jgi:quercetin dioxygenase-like cupin family protein
MTLLTFDPFFATPVPVSPAASRLLHPAGEGRSALRTLALSADELLTIAEGLARVATDWPGMADPPERRWSLVAATGQFEAWVIGWPSGGSIELHDHGDSAGAVVVASGELLETTVETGPDRRARRVSRTLATGSHLSFDAGHVHDVVNVGSVPAISVHVYAPRLTEMRFYRITGEDRLEATRTETLDLLAVHHEPRDVERVG